ncbi:MAG: ABC transporter permease [Ruminococcus sp.]|nr:ABC transporter permease [Ruminococcus sp.]
MNKLLNAGFHRLIKYKPYWLECIAAIAYGLYLMVFNDYGYEVKTDAIMYDAVPFIGIVSGIVISQFIGEEYSCGTMRNQIACGHTRREIYLSQIILSLISTVNVLNIYIITVLISGYFRNFSFASDLSQLAKIYCCCILTVLSMVAIITIISINISSKVISLLTVLSTGLILFASGTKIYGTLKEPEYRIHYNYETEYTYIRENPLYVSGIKRDINEFIVLANPYSTAYYEGELMFDEYIEYDRSKAAESPYTKIAIYSIIESAALIGAGIYLFGKKDVK